jgi:chemotaxis methyl-accepting protein methylase
LAELVADLNSLIRMLRAGSSAGAERYRALAMSLADDVHRHLDLASQVIARNGGEP